MKRRITALLLLAGLAIAVSIASFIWGERHGERVGRAHTDRDWRITTAYHVTQDLIYLHNTAQPEPAQIYTLETLLDTLLAALAEDSPYSALPWDQQYYLQEIKRYRKEHPFNIPTDEEIKRYEHLLFYDGPPAQVREYTDPHKVHPPAKAYLDSFSEHVWVL